MSKIEIQRSAPLPARDSSEFTLVSEHPDEAVEKGAKLVAEILGRGTITDLQIRTDRHIRVHNPAGIETLEEYGRISAGLVAGIVRALWRSRGGVRGEDEHEFFQRIQKRGVEDFSCEGGDVLYSVLASGRLRVQVFYDMTGMGLTARVLSDRIVPLADLSIEHSVKDLIREMAEARSGLCLITGQTGAGKSTTLAAIIGHLQTAGRHIVTVENPVEYRFPDVRDSLVTQQEVGTHVESFRQGLIDALRKRPHVIMIGEIRDRETMETALEAAQTGHLVLSTLHTRSAPETIARIVGLFDSTKVDGVLAQLAESLRFILSQGLLPKADGSGAVLCYEAVFNTAPQARAAISKHRENPAALLEWMRMGDNRIWENVLGTLVQRGVVSGAVADANQFRSHE